MTDYTFDVFFKSKGNLLDVYFTTLRLELVSCDGGRTDYISFPLGSLGPLWCIKNGVLLMNSSEGVSNVANFITA